MAHATFPVEVLTPEGEVFNGEVEMISTRTVVGTIGILANHQPIMTMLDPTELRLYKSENDILRFAQGAGYLQMTENHALLLVQDAIPAEDLDVADLEAQLDDARTRHDSAAEGSGERARAARDVRRAEAFLAVAKND